MTQAAHRAPHACDADMQPVATAPAYAPASAPSLEVMAGASTAQETPPAFDPAAADEARRSFLRMVSHELRTPLNAIIGFSEIIAGELCGPVPGQYREYGEIIRTSGHRMLKLVNQVLEIVRLEGGGLELDIRAEAIDHVFRDAVRACADELEARDIRIELDLTDEGPFGLADARSLRTAVVNLLQNAAVYSPEGGVVRLSGSVHGPLVQLRVTDAGEGVDPQEVPRLMRPFEQGENALTRRCQGAGLGWPVVDRLCRAMGGRFDVETGPGEGLSAVITLRRAG